MRGFVFYLIFHLISLFYYFGLLFSFMVNLLKIKMNRGCPRRSGREVDSDQVGLLIAFGMIKAVRRRHIGVNEVGIEDLGGGGSNEGNFDEEYWQMED